MSIEIRKKEKLLQQEQWAYLSTHPSKHLTSFCYDGDDDDDDDYTSAITPDEPVLSIEEPDNSLSMGDEHLDTISTMESDEFIKSSVENLIPIPSESEGILDHSESFSPSPILVKDSDSLMKEIDLFCTSDYPMPSSIVDEDYDSERDILIHGIFCKQCTCKSCGKDAHTGYNSPSKVLVISNPKPCNNQTIDELSQTLPIFHPTFHSKAESPFTLDSTPTYVDESPNVFNPPPQSFVYPCEFCGNDAYHGHYCTPQAPFIYPEPCYNQDFNFPQDFQHVLQQYLCCACYGGPHETCQCDQLILDKPYCKHCGGPHMNYQCPPMNQDSYNSNSLGFDQPQPQQSLVIHQPPQELSIHEMEDLNKQYLDELKCLSNHKHRDEVKIAELTENFNGMSIEIRKKEKLLQQEQWAYLSTHPSKHLTSLCYDDDEDYTSAITPNEPVLSTEEPDNSLSMGDEHRDTIPATKSDEFIQSGV
nr:hypothetical protein [Tanacetum cinerariifolium]